MPATPKQTPSAKSTEDRLKAIAGSEMAERAARLLVTPTALMQLTQQEARIVVSYMKPRIISAGTAFIKEHDSSNTGFMLLLLDGEVTVETIVVSRTSPITLTVLGPGSIVGEMGLLDGEARSATCIASTDLRCAVLTRSALEKLMVESPQVAAKLMMAVSLRIAARLRDNADKLKMYVQLTQAMQQEIDHLLPG